eukprot:1912419-Rhodomonas_salina.1
MLHAGVRNGVCICIPPHSRGRNSDPGFHHQLGGPGSRVHVYPMMSSRIISGYPGMIRLEH